MVSTISRESVELKINQEIDAQLQTIMKLPANERPKAMNDFFANRDTMVTTRIKEAQSEYDKNVEAEVKIKQVFEARAKDLFNEAWNKIKEEADKLQFVTGVTFSITRDGTSMRYADPQLLLGSLKTVATRKTREGGIRGAPMTVDGTEYASLKDVTAKFFPSKVKDGKNTLTGRDAIAKALAEGKTDDKLVHTVT